MSTRHSTAQQFPWRFHRRVPIAIGNLMWHTGVSHIGVTLMAIFANFVPVIAILLAMWFGIMPTWHHILGGLIILAGVIYAQVTAARNNQVAEDTRAVPIITKH